MKYNQTTPRTANNETQQQRKKSINAVIDENSFHFECLFDRSAATKLVTKLFRPT